MLTDITTHTHPARLVLEGVPRVHFYEGESPGDPRCPEDLTLPSVFRVILEFLGESDYGCKHCPQPDSHCKIHCTYSYLVGVTGIASFAEYVIIGHSERRRLFGETDATVNRKIVAALAAGLARSCASVRR